MSIPGDELFAYSANRELESAAKVRALESLLIKKGVISSSTV
ncbi:MAG: nitrile hydratase subunit alpha, partial [bacterium]